MKGSSIFKKLFTAFMILTLLLIGVLWFLQTQFLEGYYYNRTIENLEESGRELIQDLDGTTEVTEDLQVYLDQQSQILAAGIALFSTEGELLYETGFAGMMPMTGNGAQMPMRGHENEGGGISGEVMDVLSEEGIFSTTAIRQMRRNPMGRGGGDSEVLYTYVMGSGNILRLQSTLNPIRESIQLTQDFYLWILLIGGMIALTLSYVFSRKIARPIEDLNRVATEMNQMNFDVRYDGEKKGEVGELGTTLNHLTKTLKHTIERLQQELAKEKDLKALRREFIGRVSHELKTPIAIIKGYAEALEDGIYQNDGEKAAYLTIIQQESMKMDQMLREILDLSRLESRHMELANEPIEIKSYTEKIIRKLRGIDAEKNLKLVDTLKEPDTIVEGDPYRIEQILSNFIKNAIEHGEGQEIEIRLTESRKDEAPGRILLEIKNQGPPLSTEEQQKVWESFYKREEKKGSGLGLSIAAGLLTLMGSNFGTYNDHDGVIFYFSLEKLIK